MNVTEEMRIAQWAMAAEPPRREDETPGHYTLRIAAKAVAMKAKEKPSDATQRMAKIMGCEFVKTEQLQRVELSDSAKAELDAQRDAQAASIGQPIKPVGESNVTELKRFIYKVITLYHTTRLAEVSAEDHVARLIQPWLEREGIHLAAEPKEKRILSSTEVERVARAICSARGFDPDKCLSGYSWAAGEMGKSEAGSVCHRRAWQDHIEEARAAIASMGDDGLRARIEFLEEEVTDLWHQSTSDKPLEDHLGMTGEEYAKWVNPEAPTSLGTDGHD